jgi:ADP-ribose pyrophosphatase
MSAPPERTLIETPYLHLIDRDGWYFVRRPGLTGAVMLVALTDQNHLLFVQQQRPPLGNACIELPAGLAGDGAENAGEQLADAARRELLEETGFHAETLTHLCDAATSPGMTDETASFFLCTGLTKRHAGGGVGREKITVHEVPVHAATDWLFAQQRGGNAVAAKAFAGVLFALRATNRAGALCLL